MTKKDQLEKIKQAELKIDLPLKDTATHLVFGSGNPNAKIIFLGEAPGRFEDLSGLPFVGQAGKVLDNLLQEINLKREDVFISSVLHYRPPNNRDPKPEEILAFEPFVDQTIEIIQPKLIVTLGRFSLNKFLPNQKISQVHGQPHQIKWKNLNLTILPLYHPAAALRKGSLKQTLTSDFQQIKSFL